MIWLVRPFLFVSMLALSVVAAYVGKFLYYMMLSKKLVGKTELFEKQHGEMKVIVVGDSTALGAGAERPGDSLAGLLVSVYPDAQIINRAKSGIYISEVHAQFDKNETTNLLFCASGGMDVLFLQPVDKIAHDLRSFLQYATKQSNHIIIVTPLNLGLSPVFPIFIRSFYKNRSVKVGLVIQEVADEFNNVAVVNNLLFESKNDIPAWETISAFDQIHPNSAGYKWVFDNFIIKGLPGLK